MKRLLQNALLPVAICLAMVAGFRALNGATPHWTVVAWNDLGMHCVDGNDYSIFSILPPYNNLHAQVIDPNGKLVKDTRRVRLTYSAIADPDGSRNATSIGKTNFWSFVNALFGVTLAPDVGLAGKAMPGNTPQSMTFQATSREFVAEGIPILPYDDRGVKNYYPLMRVTARDTSGRQLATTDVVLPVSDEMDCKLCHASGSPAGAKPLAGWVNDPNPDRDYKLNVLRLHDERRNPSTYPAVLTAAGYNPAGLIASANAGKPALCARCHGSNALPGTGLAGVPPLTRALHTKHAQVLHPANNLPLDSTLNREACYSCHPGSVTLCLRGAMGNALNADGSQQMQCQSCHGNMSTVGAVTRNGWLDEPGCESCHTGTATRNSGQIRYTSVFNAAGAYRTAADPKFAVNTGKLYRMSAGHGGLQCEACHGPTHAEYPSSHRNDNLQSIQLQGHAGTIAECSTCHAQTPETFAGGPHGMHPIGNSWIDKHHDAAERNLAQCQSCHGANYRGTVLSAALADRTFRTEEGTFRFARGAQIGCYSCHNGPRGD